jgi:hypothetical protein
LLLTPSSFQAEAAEAASTVTELAAEESRLSTVKTAAVVAEKAARRRSVATMEQVGVCDEFLGVETP